MVVVLRCHAMLSNEGTLRIRAMFHGSTGKWSQVVGTPLLPAASAAFFARRRASARLRRS